ncbi:uncharacterized protein LOC103506189 [Diaphorina citri]|uniref:Uncharacterized protein LOC103506189 n=1 Tax=Diaphorina citri TaxID=121845 RepID=A0A1S3CVW4_DIACI|nr:uncharacterized protein LOC103506189 [Diaphorina citri]
MDPITPDPNHRDQQAADSKSLDSGVENNFSVDDALDETSPHVTDEEFYQSDKENVPENDNKVTEALRTLKLSGHVGFDSLPEIQQMIPDKYYITDTSYKAGTLLSKLMKASSHEFHPIFTECPVGNV